MTPRFTAPLGLLAVAVASLALLAAGAAYSGTDRVADTNRVELVIASNHMLRADVMWASQDDGQGVFLWIDNSSASQLFDLVNVGNGFFQIKARHSGKCLMLERGRGTVGNGTRVVQYPCTGPGYQSAQWSFRDMNGPCADNALCIDSGKRAIRNRYTGKCLDTANPSGRKPRQQAVLQLWTCTTPGAWNADNQTWKIVDASTKKPITQFR